MQSSGKELQPVWALKTETRIGRCCRLVERAENPECPYPMTDGCGPRLVARGVVSGSGLLVARGLPATSSREFSEKAS